MDAGNLESSVVTNKDKRRDVCPYRRVGGSKEGQTYKIGSEQISVRKKLDRGKRIVGENCDWGIYLSGGKNKPTWLGGGK